MSGYISQNLRSQIESIDRKRCCYCLTTQANSGMPMTIDHIQAVSKGGLNTIKNLCLACQTCNEYIVLGCVSDRVTHHLWLLSALR